VNTPAHLIFGAAAFARPNAPAVNAAALFGALLPDLSLYLLTGWSLFVMGIPPGTVFGELYFSPQWQGIFAVDNSIPLWALGLGLGLALRSRLLIAFAGAGLLHLVFDFALHHDDARRHFWPITDFVFRSPVSYWDPRHFGNIAGPVEIGVSLLLCVLLWRRFRGWFARVLIAAAALAELAPGLMFMLMFRG
jgi:hypothetical protein